MCRRRTEFHSVHSRASGQPKLRAIASTDPSSPLARGRSALARPVGAGLLAAVLTVMLGGCSDFYFDRRDTIALGAGDAIAANEAEQIIDPWPAHSGNTNIATDGQRMQAAVERYRNDRVTQPVDPMTPQVAAVSQSNTQSQSASAGAAPATSTTSTLVISAPPPAATASE
jgi:hypothetical protein